VSWSTILCSDWRGYNICLAHRPTTKLSNTARVPKEAVPEEYFNLDNMEGFEKQIMSIMETVKKQ
jgi:hypothetical protein